MASIIDHRHPLQDPSQPEHATKNRPDKAQAAQQELGHQFVQNLGLANARDIVKMLLWNDKYGIKFMRLSSEMFPFASHPVHGYKLAPFASEVLAEAGKVAAKLGHRLTTHPGQVRQPCPPGHLPVFSLLSHSQFTQLGSPRKEVVEAAVRDLEYHDEMLSLLQLTDQQNRDAVMIIHMGGTFGDKAATLDRFRENYVGLSDGIKARLVLENDDVSWTVHDLLPICEELNIPLVLDYHHHNILFDAEHCREGTYDISQPGISERIAATWRRKGIKQKMHYSEPCAGAVTPRDRRKHSPRVATLPPCPNDIDLMIEAKDKEQAVFELMRTFKLPRFDEIHDMVPHQRLDENRPPPKVLKKATGNGKGSKRRRTTKDGAVGVEETAGDDNIEETTAMGIPIPDEEIGMGGPENRVYWPPGHEEWLRPKKREAKRSQVAEESE
jgi:UV DNA damage endonuclease